MMGLVIAVPCLVGGIGLLAPLVVQLLKNDGGETATDLRETAEVIVGSTVEQQAA